jgi:hypothetical protein
MGWLRGFARRGVDGVIGRMMRLTTTCVLRRDHNIHQNRGQLFAVMEFIRDLLLLYDIFLNRGIVSVRGLGYLHLKPCKGDMISKLHHDITRLIRLR